MSAASCGQVPPSQSNGTWARAPVRLFWRRNQLGCRRTIAAPGKEVYRPR